MDNVVVWFDVPVYNCNDTAEDKEQIWWKIYQFHVDRVVREFVLSYNLLQKWISAHLKQLKSHLNRFTVSTFDWTFCNDDKLILTDMKIDNRHKGSWKMNIAPKIGQKWNRLQQINENLMSSITTSQQTDHFLMLANGTSKTNDINAYSIHGIGKKLSEKKSFVSNFNGVHFITHARTKKEMR